MSKVKDTSCDADPVKVKELNEGGGAGSGAQARCLGGSNATGPRRWDQEAVPGCPKEVGSKVPQFSSSISASLGLCLSSLPLCDTP